MVSSNATDIDVEGNLDVSTGKKVLLVENDQYICGDCYTGMTINSDQNISVNSESTIALDASDSVSIAAPNTTFNGSVTITGNISGNAFDLKADKNYVDSIIQGLDVKQSVISASTGNIILTNVCQSLDGTTISVYWTESLNRQLH